MTLAGINAPADVRLACQIRPLHAHHGHAAGGAAARRVVGRTQPPSHAQGIERTLAVLFLDTRGFTSISEARLPYDVVFILNRLFAAVGEAIRSHGGKIDKYLGDGLMAIFGTEAGEDGRVPAGARAPPATSTSRSIASTTRSWRRSANRCALAWGSMWDRWL